MKNQLLTSILFVFMSALCMGQDTTPPNSVGSGAYLGKSIALKDFPLMTNAPDGKSEFRIVPNNFPVNGYESPSSLPIGGDLIRQSALNFSQQQRGLLVNFDGPNVSEGQALPPDPSGAVGPNHYVSAVNAVVEVFDKEGNSLAGPTSLGNFIGDGQNSGDPIVMYDQLADRWFVSQFNTSNNGLAIAISETPDPTGAYFLYEFLLDFFPDYPHYGVWHDAYYLTTNKQGDNVFALERDVMIAGGDNPQIFGFTLPGVIENPNTVFSPEPAYLLGTEFDPTTPGYITYLQDDGWGASFDHLKVWELDIDFQTPGNSSISNPLEVPVTPFDSFLAPFGFGELQQPGTGQRIDMITGVISYAAHYRPFETHNSWLVTFNVDVQEDNNTAGVRWIELRNSGTDPWTVFQEGTYAPADGNSRFMGSGAIDAQGNIGLAFNIGGPDMPVGIAYTGRFVNDPLGVMTIPEETIINGVGVQTSSNRFGDYSQLSMDPDNFTFWHTAEYFTSNNFWTARIASFNLSSGFETDLGISNIINPNDGSLTTTETVEVQVRNFGTEDQSNFDIELRLDGALVAIENFEGTIIAGDFEIFTFTQTVDLSIVGQVYEIEARTILAGDEAEPNNTFTKTVRHLFGNDVGVSEITSPTSGESLSDSEDFTVEVTNFGAMEQSNIDVSYTIDGVTVNEVVSGPIASLETISYTFAQTADLSSVQTFNISATTLLSGDQDPSNDGVTAEVTNTFCMPESNCDTFDDGVTLFQLADQDLTTNCGSEVSGYSDDTAIEFNFSLSENPFEGTLQVGFAASVFALWIDFNDNAIFEPQELVANDFVANANQDFNFTVDFQTIPAVTTGSHLMRLRGEDEDTPGDVLDPCGDLAFGRTNDYTANIEGTLSISDATVSSNNLEVITLGNNQFDIQLHTIEEERVFMAVYNLLGQQLKYKPIARRENGFGFTLDMSQMAAGVYFVRLGTTNARRYDTAKIIVQ